MHREKQRLHGLGLILSLPVPPVTSSQPLSALPRRCDPGWTLGQPGRARFLQDCMRCPCSGCEHRGGRSEARRDPCSIRGGKGSWEAGEAPGAISEPQAEAWGPGGGFVPRAPRTLLRAPMLRKIYSKRRTKWKRMRWLDSITYSMDMNLSKL